MANFQYSADIINDALFRAGEKVDGTSDLDAQALIYLNRVYRGIWLGGGEFLPGINEDWWWLKKEGSLILEPVVKAGTVSVTNNSASITFSSAPAASQAGRFFKVNDHADVFVISAHTAAATAATLDTVYTSDTDTAANYKSMKLGYSLASDVLKPIGPMRAYQNSRNEIHMMSLGQMENEYPLNEVSAGVPHAFAPVTESTVRFSHYGDDDSDDYIRLDYDYLRKPDDLTDSDSEEPAVPLQYRHVLSDGVLYHLLGDKEDSKRSEVGAAFRAGIRSMVNENRSRWVYAGRQGHIAPRRGGRARRGPLRTESGSIIG